jgi:ActR/RegA family two-component response regulator
VETSQTAGAAKEKADRRVLLECDDPTIQDGLERVLRESGYAVSIRAGPVALGAGCTLVESGRCGRVDAAQIVVHALDPTDDSNREVLAALVQRHPDTAIVVETNLAADDELGNVRQVPFPMSRTAVLDAIRR